MLILNKQKIVEKLLQFLSAETLQAVRCSVLDLCIALVKDLRQEVYDEFLHQMLPAVITSIDGNDLNLLDKVF